MKIKTFLVVVLFLCFSSFTFCQESDPNHILGVGISVASFKSDDVRLNSNQSTNAYISYDYISTGFLATGFDLSGTVIGDAKFLNARIKVGTVLGQNREWFAQFPIYTYFGYYNLDDQISEYSFLSLGVKAGVRFYIGNKLAIEGHYNYPYNLIVGELSSNFKEAEGVITGQIISLGISYDLIKL